MTLQQEVIAVINHLPEDKIKQVIQFAKFLSFNMEHQEKKDLREINEDGYVRKPGILKKKMIMSEDFDETPQCFKEYM